MVLLRGHAVTRAIFGDVDDDDVVVLLDRLTKDTLGSGVGRVLFAHCSVGGVFGLALTDARRVVVKAHQPAQPFEFLTSANDIQQLLWADGFPCPRPLSGPVRFAAGTATIEELTDSGS